MHCAYRRHKMLHVCYATKALTAGKSTLHVCMCIFIVLHRCDAHTLSVPYKTQSEWQHTVCDRAANMFGFMQHEQLQKMHGRNLGLTHVHLMQCEQLQQLRKGSHGLTCTDTCRCHQPGPDPSQTATSHVVRPVQSTTSPASIQHTLLHNQSINQSIY